MGQALEPRLLLQEGPAGLRSEPVSRYELVLGRPHECRCVQVGGCG